MKNIVLFASGGGSNAGQIMRYFAGGSKAKVAAVFTNNANAGVIEKATQHNVPAIVFTREEMNNGALAEKVNHYNPDLIVLAGFLWKFPTNIIAQYPDKVINIHPALLPKYGGKGMFGMHVHRKVLEDKELESGISIHYVNDNYDEGNIIFQERVNLEGCTTAEDVAARVLELEHRHFPQIIAELLK